VRGGMEASLVGEQSARQSASLAATEGGTRFLRERLILICKVFAFIDVVYYALFVLALSLDAKVSYFTLFTSSVSLETAGEYALFAIVALSARFGPDSVRLLRTLDVVLLIGLGGLWSSWCFMHPYPALGAYEMVLALVACPVLRAVLIPSSGVRTFLVTLAACIPGLLAAFVAARVRNLTMMTPASLTVLVSNWCAISVVFSTVASSVVYGLRSQVQKARRLGQYTLLDKIGEGGMGVVYLARHALLRRPTVVKVVGENASPEAFDRFEREVQLTSQLTHPNTIAIYDFGRTEAGAFYYAMEHLDGMDLEGIVAATGPFEPARVVHVLRQVCGALEEAHSAGLLHRDIKPGNIFLCPRRALTDVVKVLDFGLVKDLRGSKRAEAVTQAGLLLGTPLYMSPELIIAPDSVDARSDIYAVGAVAYYLLTGEPVFSGQSAVEVCLQHLNATPVPPRERLKRALPAELEAIVLRCLAKDPATRFADVRALREALEACTGFRNWTEGDALDWWDRNRSLLAAARAPASADAPTLEVGLAARFAEERRLPAPASTYGFMRPARR
jgi:eukaryotic-like serine/threonine-protein kinase